MLSVTGLTKRFHGRDILRDVSLSLGQGEVVGLIGRSGAGKSTLARCLVGLEVPEAGRFEQNGVTFVPGRGDARKDIQYMWQDSSQSLSPYLTAHGAVLETLNGFSIGPAERRSSQAAGLLDRLGVTQARQGRRPHALSGGQCQRVALTRALAAEPKMLILDEPLSALDLSTQIRTIGLLKALHGATGLTILIVSHDLAPLRQLATRVLVLDAAAVVEDIPMHHFRELAAHPLTKAYAGTLPDRPVDGPASVM